MARELQIERAGDFFARKTVPKIRLTGRWLERAGFKPGARVLVESIEQGVIVLRCLPLTCQVAHLEIERTLQ